MYKRLFPAVVCGVIGAMALAACGSSNSGTTSAADSPSASQSAAQPATSEPTATADTSSAGESASSSASESGSAAADSGQTGNAVPAFPNKQLTDKALKIGLLLPETETARYETKDRPYFTAALKILCPNCELLYANANSDQATQQQQAQSQLTQGAQAIVVDPWDGVAAASLVAAAKAEKVPVIAYDRLIHSPDLAYVVSNNYEQVGQLQGKALIDKLAADGVKPADGGIIMINGAETDNNAGNIKKGALSQITPSGFEILSETDTWDPAAARTWVDGQITRFGKKIIGVYSANDNNGASAIAAFAAAGLPMPPLTGLDASLVGIQNILIGKQYMTTYNSFQKEAESAAVAAVELALGQTPPSNGKVDGHPALLNEPTAVTLENIKDTVVKDGFWTVADICTAAYKDACTKAGLQ
ncbi:MAG: substrate-binding domain-containing protein [Nakamurella sp.]